MDSGGIALIMLFVVATATGGAILCLSAIIGRRKGSPEGKLPYECGIDPVGSTHRKMPVKFFLIAVLFIIFDVEVVFFYPWALVFREAVIAGSGALVFAEMIIFLTILGLALLYAWGRGALEWEK